MEMNVTELTRVFEEKLERSLNDNEFEFIKWMANSRKSTNLIRLDDESSNTVITKI